MNRFGFIGPCSNRPMEVLMDVEAPVAIDTYMSLWHGCVYVHVSGCIEFCVAMNLWNLLLEKMY